MRRSSVIEEDWLSYWKTFCFFSSFKNMFMWSRFVASAIIFIFLRCSNSSTLHVVNITSCCCSCGLKANLKWRRRDHLTWHVNKKKPFFNAKKNVRSEKKNFFVFIFRFRLLSFVLARPHVAHQLFPCLRCEESIVVSLFIDLFFDTKI